MSDLNVQNLNSKTGSSAISIADDGTTTVSTFTSTGIDDNATSTAVTLDSSGNVGIGTDAPINTSANYGELTLNGATGGILSLADDGVAKAKVQSAIDDLYLQSVGSTIFRNGGFTGGDEAMRIDSSGRLLVGTTSSKRRLTVHESGVTAVFNRTVGTSAVVEFEYGGVNAGFIISSAGGTPSFLAASDIRLKDNITDHESELANVMALRPTRWDWKDKAKGTGEGFIAQDLEQTAWSDLVSEGDDGFKQVAGLGAVETRLIKAIQEQQELIQDLRARVAQLEEA